MTIDQRDTDVRRAERPDTVAGSIDGDVLRRTLEAQAASPTPLPDEGKLVELLEARDRFVARRRRLVGSGAFVALVVIGTAVAAVAWRGRSHPDVPAGPARPVASIVDEPTSNATPTTSLTVAAPATTSISATVQTVGIVPADPPSPVVRTIAGAPTRAPGPAATAPSADDGAPSAVTRPADSNPSPTTQATVQPSVVTSVPESAAPRPASSPTTSNLVPVPVTAPVAPGPATRGPINDEPTLPPNAPRG